MNKSTVNRSPMKHSFYTLCAVVGCIFLASCGGATEDARVQEAVVEADVAAPVAGAVADGPIDEPDMEPGIIDESAVELLKAMTGKLASLPEFTVTLETGFDVMQPDGQKLEFGSRRTAAIRRPDRAHFGYQERTGKSGELVFDGAAIWAYDREQNVYATMEQPGDIDATLDMVTDGLGIPVPVNDFFAADPSLALAEGVLEARDLGPSTLANQPGRQLALRKPGVDYQIWVRDADSLPMRVVITYHEAPGEPQFWAQFLRWDTAPENSDSVFEFSPPEGSERIRFAVADASSNGEEETL